MHSAEPIELMETSFTVPAQHSLRRHWQPKLSLQELQLLLSSLLLLWLVSKGDAQWGSVISSVRRARAKRHNIMHAAAKCTNQGMIR